MSAPWLSVITVVKDDPSGFASTLASVLSQNTDGVEIVVVDSSRDRDEIPALLTGCAATYAWVPPSGVYPAMNVALTLATGDYAYFANAGDSLADPSVLGQLRPVLTGPPWAFGPVEIVEQSGRRVITPSWDYQQEFATGFSRGQFPSHQGTFARRELLVELGGFDASYEIAADYAMALRLALHGDPEILPFTVATFREGGLSTRNWQRSFREFHRARREIWGPTGLEALRERLNTICHFSAVWVNRNIMVRVRRGSDE